MAPTDRSRRRTERRQRAFMRRFGAIYLACIAFVVAVTVVWMWWTAAQ